LISLRFTILEKWANSRLPLNVQKPKMLQLQNRALPLHAAGGSARARHGAVPRTPDIVGYTDRQTDIIAMAKTHYSSTCCCA